MEIVKKKLEYLKNIIIILEFSLIYSAFDALIMRIIEHWYPLALHNLFSFFQIATLTFNLDIILYD